MVKARRKLIMSFNVQDDDAPVVHLRTKEKGMWFVVIHVENRTEQIDIEMENNIPCDLLALRHLVEQNFTESVGELSPVTEASFKIYQEKV